jgi:GNAT superfamily N-acetyltransferase
VVDGDRRVFDLSYARWQAAPSLLNFETSFGTLAWEGGPSAGDVQRFERPGGDGPVAGWARVAPGYARIRRPGVWDEAPASLVWLVDPGASALEVADRLAEIIEWAEDRCGSRDFVTSHAAGDVVAEEVLQSLGFEPDPSEPFGIYLQQRLGDGAPRTAGAGLPDGYVLTTMAELDDAELRAEAHRVAWDGSTRSASDVRATMAQWPYRADLDVVVLTVADEPVGSALAWYDEAYDYGEFEPVGVSAAHRGRGLAGCLLRDGLRRLREAGASHAVVGARGDDDYPVPRKVYGSVGFEVVMTQRIVRRR